MRTLVLASASPARLRLLRDAGFEPVVVVSGVDESGVVASGPGELVETLAVRKAVAVASRLDDPGAIVVGCDSALDVDGAALGKPLDAERATAYWQRLRGRSATLLTGHCVIDVATGGRASAVRATRIDFGRPDDAEIAAYVASGEPLQVAGGFTIDGRGAAFVDRIDGDHGNVVGLSLPLLRDLLDRLGLRIVDLWR